MKSDVAIKTDVYDYLKGTSLVNEVNGILSKRKRPLNSNSEDIVISVLSNLTKQRQEAYVNVNVYVPYIWVGDQWDENDPRIEELCELCFEALTAVHFRCAYFKVEEQRVLKVNGKEESVINNKLYYQIINE